MTPEPATVSCKLPIPTIEDIMEEFLKTRGSQQQIDCLARQAKIPNEYILKMSDITTGQRNNPTWHLTRRGRLKASNFGCVLKAKRVTQSLLNRLLGEYDLSGVKAVQWGVNNDQEALKAFPVLTRKTVQEAGIWLDVSGILGASPAGIVVHETVLEPKCPYTERNQTIEEAIATSPTFCLEKAEDGNGYILQKDHVYWDQVQGEMFFTQRKFCYFIVWTSKDVAVVKIEQDETWDANIPILKEFYFKHIFPKIVEGAL